MLVSFTARVQGGEGEEGNVTGVKVVSDFTLLKI
jgi:hypothetical protein